MKAVIQKTGAASVEINGKKTGVIDGGLVILLGVTHEDTEKDVEYLSDKICNLRLFDEESKNFEKSIKENGKEILVISQFTLYASCKKGRRPDFTKSAKPEIAKPLYQKFVSSLRQKGIKTETGEFGAMMKVNLINEGPVTIILDSKE